MNFNSDIIDWPKVSIVTVIYNSEKYIEATIKNVISQKYPNLDFVIIDGGSTDGTMDIVNSYSEHIATIISEEDNGIYNAMNKARKYCKGDWICFLNSGDLFFDSNVLLTVFSIINKLNSDFIYGDTSYYSLLEKFEYQEGRMVKEKDFIFNFPICHQSMFFSRNLIHEMNWYDESYSVVADWDIATRIFQEPKYKKLYISTCISKFLIDEVNWKNGISALWEWVVLTYKYRSKLTTFISFLIFLLKSIRYLIVVNLRHLKIYSIYRSFKVQRISKSLRSKSYNV
tara:strand:+ start:424 stop:1278 length:855 start_codon:yes stop_codon:yes gene_type:complete